MNLGTLKEIVGQAIAEMQGKRSRPSWIAQRALQIADPDKTAPLSIAFAADLEFRQIARDMLRHAYEPENPEDKAPRQHALFPGLQANYPRRVTNDEEPEYVPPELLTTEDVEWNVARMRAGAKSLQRGANALEAWAIEQGLLGGMTPVLQRLRCELLERMAGKRPVRVLVIDTFGCGHARAFNTFIDRNSQARCVVCRQARTKAA